ncbi:hypothetical protein BDW22DRAFT_1343175 [Trametopsis cervina]|nr:hypothetical protein BDW22DRAFT_1343175 [Trametopsis cervina]
MAPPDTVAAVRNVLVGNRICIAIAALNIYDYAITFEAERTRIWKRKRTRVSLLFLANRYLAILYSAVIILKLGDSIEAPRSLLVVSALRIRTLWPDETPFWPVLVLVLYLIPFGTDIYSYSILQHLTPFDLFGCAPQAGSSNPVFLIGISLCNRSCVIVADIIVLRSTWIKTWAHRKEMARFGLNTSVPFLLLRDGAISFIVLLGLNVLQILITCVPGWASFAAVNEYVDWPALYPIVISRFLLDLRQLNDLPEDDMEDGVTSSLRFAQENTMYNNSLVVLEHISGTAVLVE